MSTLPQLVYPNAARALIHVEISIIRNASQSSGMSMHARLYQSPLQMGLVRKHSVEIKLETGKDIWLHSKSGPLWEW